jgi:hypothetical protein
LRAPRAVFVATVVVFAALALPFTSPAPAGTVAPTGMMRQRGVATAAALATAPDRVEFHGGAVISHVKIYAVRYGSGTNLPQVASTTPPSISSFLNGAFHSPYADWLREYDTWNEGTGSNQSIDRGTFAGLYTISPAAARNDANINDTDIRNELNAQIKNGHLPPPDANSLYVLFFRKGQTIHAIGGTSVNYFCAYHNGADLNVGHTYYAVIPYEANNTGCGTASPFDNLTATVSHEVVESITDPDLSAWYSDSTGNENADICNQQDTYIQGGDHLSYRVQLIWSNAANACSAGHDITGDIAVATTRPPVEDVFFRGADAGMYWIPFNTSTINTTPPVIALGGGFDSAPTVVPRAPYNGQQIDDVFGEGLDHALYWSVVNLTTGAHSGWQGLGGYITGRPQVLAQTGRFPWLDIFVRGFDGALYANILNLGTGQEGAWSDLGGYISSDPSVVSRTPFNGTHYYDIYMRGSDDLVYWWAFNSDTGTVAWRQQLPGSAIDGNPVAIAHAGGRFPWEEVYARGAAGPVVHDAVNVGNGATSGWGILNGYYTSQPVVFSRTPFNGQIADDIYGRQADGVLRNQAFFPATGGTTGLGPIGTVPPAAVLGVTSFAGHFSLEDLYTRSAAGTIIYTYLDPTNGNRLAWVNLGGS